MVVVLFVDNVFELIKDVRNVFIVVTCDIIVCVVVFCVLKVSDLFGFDVPVVISLDILSGGDNDCLSIVVWTVIVDGVIVIVGVDVLVGVVDGEFVVVGVVVLAAGESVV